jgi:hypothetical protein
VLNTKKHNIQLIRPSISKSSADRSRFMPAKCKTQRFFAYSQRIAFCPQASPHLDFRLQNNQLIMLEEYSSFLDL